ncbi:hypothetical protein PENTCL1PPCAC_21615, partial [Pristionchus entomophagus]
FNDTSSHHFTSLIDDSIDNSFLEYIVIQQQRLNRLIQMVHHTIDNPLILDRVQRSLFLFNNLLHCLESLSHDLH